MSTKRARRPVLSVASAIALAGLVPVPATAIPTSSFTFAPDQPAPGSPVAFDFTGSCDEPPCRVQWRWFRDGASSRGTAMGEGEHVQYAFAEAGTYAVVATVTNALPTHGSATATRDVVVEPAALPEPVVLEEDDPAVVWDGWAAHPSRVARGGYHRVGHGTAGLRVRRGRVRFLAVRGPRLGRAVVLLDGRPVRRVDLRSQAPARSSWTVRVGRRARPHQLDVRAAGRRPISIDGFVLRHAGSARRLDDASTAISYGAWNGRRVPGASGGTVRSASAAGSVIDLAFSGSSLTWVTALGPRQGRALVRIDGVAVAAVDNRSTVPVAGVQRVFDGLTAGAHTATVVVRPPDRDHPAARAVVVDAFLVR